MAAVVDWVNSTNFTSLTDQPFTFGDEFDVDPLAGMVGNARLLCLLLGCLMVTLVINNIAEKMHLPVPEAILTVACGIVMGGLAILTPYVHGEMVVMFENIMCKTFMLCLISPIIFAEGYGMKSHQFFDNIVRILMHAFVGTTISTVIVAFTVYYLPALTGFEAHITMAECLAFGALISATDPVTTLAIFKEMNMVETGLAHLYYSVLGESILNDAVGITLFDGFSEFVKEGEEFTLASIGPLCQSFAITFIGSMMIGGICGVLTAAILKMARMAEHSENEDHYHFNVPEMGIMVLMSYLPFVIATAIPPLSGIVAVLFAGISMRHYAHYNLTETTRKTFLPVAHLLASLSETYVFLILGAAIFIVEDYNLVFLGWTVLACLVGRAAQVYPLGLVTNIVSSATKFELKEMHVQWFAGLRGAVAFMCALSFPQHGLSQNRGVVLTTTVTIAFVSMLAMGWPTASCLKCMQVKGKLSEEQKVDLAQSEAGTYLAAEDATVVPPRQQSCLSKIKPCLTSLDEKLIKVLMVKDGQEERAANQQEEKQMERRLSVALLKGGGTAGGLHISTLPSVIRDEERGTSLQEARPEGIQRRASLPPGAVEGRIMSRRRSSRTLVDP